jgi:nucleoside-diphosphate-sugar epimerase
MVVLTRAADGAAATAKLWKSLQLHMDLDEFREHRGRLHTVAGDLHAPGLGLSSRDHVLVLERCDSVLHIAASLNRKSAKACLNSNLRGSLSVIKLGREIADGNGLKRFSHVSTVAVAGKRDREIVREDEAIEWSRSDYDPYGRTKKFCEHMVRELLPDIPLTFFRPSIVMGDSRFEQTTQFDMVQAFCFLAQMRIVPMPSDVRLDIVNADFVGKAIAHLHRKVETDHQIYHLSSGNSSKSAWEIGSILAQLANKKLRFAPRLSRTFARVVSALNHLPKSNPIYPGASLMKVFWPYITYDTVFDNTRVVHELGSAPTPFTEYCGPLYNWCTENRFRYPYVELPNNWDKAAA